MRRASNLAICASIRDSIVVICASIRDCMVVICASIRDCMVGHLCLHARDLRVDARLKRQVHLLHITPCRGAAEVPEGFA